MVVAMVEKITEKSIAFQHVFANVFDLMYANVFDVCSIFDLISETSLELVEVAANTRNLLTHVLSLKVLVLL